MRYCPIIAFGLISVLIGVVVIFADVAVGFGLMSLLLGLLCIISGLAMYLLRTPTAEDMQRQNPRNSATWHITRGGCLALGVAALTWLGVTLLLERFVPSLQQKLIPGGSWRNMSLGGLISIIVTVPPMLWLFRKVRYYYIASERQDVTKAAKGGDDSGNTTSAGN